RRTENRGVAVECDGGAEEIVGRAVARDEFVALDPGSADVGEEISGAAAGVAIDRRYIRRDQHIGPAHRDRVAEVVARAGVVGRKLLRFGPGASRLREDVRGAVTVGAGGADDERGAV